MFGEEFEEVIETNFINRGRMQGKGVTPKGERQKDEKSILPTACFILSEKSPAAPQL
jgi:hypothetical protein